MFVESEALERLSTDLVEPWSMMEILVDGACGRLVRTARYRVHNGGGKLLTRREVQQPGRRSQNSYNSQLKESKTAKEETPKLPKFSE